MNYRIKVVVDTERLGDAPSREDGEGATVANST